MTKQEILDGLEGLKDMVNDSGKSQINGLKAGVSQLTETATAAAKEDDEEKPLSRGSKSSR